MKRRLFSLAFSLAFCLAQAHAAITIVNAGQRNQTAATNVITTGVDCPVGSMVLTGAAYATLADTLASTTDSVSNTYGTPFDNITGTGVGIGWNFANNTTHDLPNGGSINSTFSGSTASEVNAGCISGLVTSSPKDVVNKTSQGLAANSGTVSSGVLAQATEIVIGGAALSAAGGTFSCGSGWTKLSQISQIPTIILCYQIVASTASLTWSPSWVNTANYVLDITSYKGVPPTNAPGTMMLIGVGS